MSGLFYHVLSLIVVPFLVNWRDCLLLFSASPFDVEVPVAEHDLLALPLRLGGLRVSNPVSSASYLYDSSLHSTVVLVKSLVTTMLFELDAHFESGSLAKVDYRKLMDSVFIDWFDRLLPFLILINVMPFCELEMVIPHHGCLYYL